MLQSQKHVFWQALIVTIAVFLIGIFLGILLENARTGRIVSLYEKSEIDLLDVRLQSEIYTSDRFNCDFASNEIINFADRIFEEAKVLGRYEKATSLTEDIILQHKKYDILRATLMIASEKVRDKCNPDYIEIVYIYQYNDPDLEIDARQSVFSRLLSEYKEEQGSNILLIPMAGDLDVSSIDLILNNYDLDKTKLPIILINRELIITNLTTIDELKDKINEL